MCYHVRRPSEEELYKYVNSANFGLEYRWEASYTITGEYPALEDANGWGHPSLPVILNRDPHNIQQITWGFLPGKVKDEAEISGMYKKYYGGLNAKGDEAFTGRLYKNAIIGQRCIVLAPAFYESHHLDPDSSKPEKFPFRIQQKGKTMNALAGIWNDCFIQETGEIRRTLAIVTTSANEAMQLIHNSKKRMPAYVRAEHFPLWLSETALTKEEVDQVITPPASSLFHFQSLDKSFNAAKKSPLQPAEPAEYDKLSDLMQQLQALEL